MSSGVHILDGQLGRGPTAGVEAVELAGFRFVNDGEEIAAQSIARGFDQAKHRVRGDRRVHGVAAELQDLCARLRSEGLAGGDDPKAGHHH